MKDVSNNIEIWREFFTKYQGRILFGTDNYNNFITDNNHFELIVRNEPVRKLLDTFKEDKLKVFARFELPDWIYPEEQENLYKGNSFAIESLEEIKAYYENEVSK